MRHALIVIDLQQGPFGEAPPWHDVAGLIDRVNRLAGAVRRADGAVVFIQHDGPPGDPYQPGSPGSRFLSALDVRPDDAMIHKQACDSFLHTSLEEFLHTQSIDRLIVTGWATDYCVDTTVRSALARGYRTIVPTDGHTTSDRRHLPATKIIEHHNAIWADFIAPGGPALVQPCAEIMLS